MREQFIEKRFHRSSLAVIEAANMIISEYMEDGLRLTLRQLYYQFVARGFSPNTQRDYHRLGQIVNDARLAGLIDWYAIEDRTRNLRGTLHWDDPEHAIADTAEKYRLDKWADQDFRVEVWIEKEALIGVVERVCRKLDINYFACRGYVSQSEQWRAGKRFSHYLKNDQKVIVLHLGDHDPSGKDMTRDNDDRLAMFTYNFPGVFFDRLALNMDQVEEHNPPPNPAKVTDTRYRDYVREFGESSWELDALDPKYIQKLIEDTATQYRDDDRWDAILARESDDLRLLEKTSENWASVVEFLDSDGGMSKEAQAWLL